MSQHAATQPRVCVMLSTYNGERFLREQLDSVLGQLGVDLTLLVRDDGSTDGTRTLLADYARRDDRIQLHDGTNLGVVGSFFEAMRLAAATAADFFALCDQDDVWLPTKLSEAITHLSSDTTEPRMYCSTVRFVDRDLKDLGTSYARRRPGFGNAVVENIATGCTVVMNRALLELVNSAPPRHALVHDWWIYMVATAFGEVTFDTRSWILYRQHGGNAIGGSASFTRSLVVRLQRLRLRNTGVFRCSDQAREFLACFGSRCKAGDRVMLEEMLASRNSLLRRMRFAFSGKVRRTRWFDDAILRGLIVFGFY